MLKACCDVSTAMGKPLFYSRPIMTFVFCLLTCLVSRAEEQECPDPDFHKFVTKYAENKSLQYKYIKLPLLYISTDTIDGPFREKLRRVDDIPFLKRTDGYVLKNEAGRRKENLRIESKSGKNQGRIELYQPDTDYYLIYRFKYINDCWYLVAIDNRTP